MAQVGAITRESDELILTHPDKQVKFRTAHFLNPTHHSSDEKMSKFAPPPVEPSEPISRNVLNFLKEKVGFYGVFNPQNLWILWVEDMRVTHGETWRRAGIYEAIMASTIQIPNCYASLLTVAEKWCSHTNSFVFPWGEATITLEDVMALGGYSATGHSVMMTNLHTTEMVKAVLELRRVRSAINRTRHKKTTQGRWLKRWFYTRSPYEHEAFLALWLSRFVMSGGGVNTINKNIFCIAVVLARGHRIALAPAVLASLYRDLKPLKEMIVDVKKNMHIHANREPKTLLRVWAPFNLLLAWIWERFPKLSPKQNPNIKYGARLERWRATFVRSNHLNNTSNEVHEIIECADNFVWRPYSTPLKGWSFNPDMESYIRCIRRSLLEGMGCVESYLPQRVAMQFGFDQDIPVTPRDPISYGIEQFNSAVSERAWNHYNRPVLERPYRPSKDREFGATFDYIHWRLSWFMENTEHKHEVPPGFKWGKGHVAGSGNVDEAESSRAAENRLAGKRKRFAETPAAFDPKGKSVLWPFEASPDGPDTPPGFSPKRKWVAAEADNLSLNPFDPNTPAAFDPNTPAAFDPKGKNVLRPFEASLNVPDTPPGFSPKRKMAATESEKLPQQPQPWVKKAKHSGNNGPAETNNAGGITRIETVLLGDNQAPRQQVKSGSDARALLLSLMVTPK